MVVDISFVWGSHRDLMFFTTSAFADFALPWRSCQDRQPHKRHLLGISKLLFMEDIELKLAQYRAGINHTGYITHVLVLII